MDLSININEVVALIISVLIGTVGYTAFLKLVKKEKPNVSYMFWLFFLNLLVAHTFSEVMKVFKYGEYRSAFLPLISFMGLYFLIWLDKRYLKIFDGGLKKATGIDLNDNENENIENEVEPNIENDEQKIE